MKIDVIALAREAGFRTGSFALPKGSELVFAEGVCDNIKVELERFAQLVQQATAEKCAQLCHERMMELRYSSCEFADDADMKSDGAEVCADAIRAKFAPKAPDAMPKLPS